MEFYDDNATRRYPLDDAAPPTRFVRSADEALIDLPMATVLDAGFLLGPSTGCDPSAHPVYINTLSRTGDVVTFNLVCVGATGTATFTHERTITDVWGATSQTAAAATSGPCGYPFTGQSFLVTGDLSQLSENLPDGATLTGGPAVAFDATLVQSYRDDFVTSLNVANQDRTQVLLPGLVASPEGPAVYRVQARCLVGAVFIQAGANAVVTEDAASTALSLGASVGSGTGESCTEIPTYPGEAPPAGSLLLSGGPGCGQVVLSVTGVIGPSIALSSGGGVAILPDPDSPHGLVLDFTRGA